MFFIFIVFIIFDVSILIIVSDSYFVLPEKKWGNFTMENESRSMRTDRKTWMRKRNVLTKCQNKHNNGAHSLANGCGSGHIVLTKFQSKHTHSHTLIYIIRIPQTIESFGQFLKKRQKWWNSIERKGSMRRILGVRLCLFRFF